MHHEPTIDHHQRKLNQELGLKGRQKAIENNIFKIKPTVRLKPGDSAEIRKLKAEVAKKRKKK